MKDVPENNTGLKKLPTEVRNKMGFKKYGGSVKKMSKGGKSVTDKMSEDEFVKKFSEKPEAPDLAKLRKTLNKKASGGAVKKMKHGGKCKVDGIAMRGKTKIKGKR